MRLQTLNLTLTLTLFLTITLKLTLILHLSEDLNLGRSRFFDAHVFTSDVYMMFM